MGEARACRGRGRGRGMQWISQRLGGFRVIVLYRTTVPIMVHLQPRILLWRHGHISPLHKEKLDRKYTDFEFEEEENHFRFSRGSNPDTWAAPKQRLTIRPC